jgi:hypothetical protein
MSIAILANVPQSRAEWLDFSFQNFVEHQRINDKVEELYGLQIPMRAIDPIPENYVDWLIQHQTLHSAAAQATDVPTYDFRQVDFANFSSLSAWILQHYQSHLNLNEVLSL